MANRAYTLQPSTYFDENNMRYVGWFATSDMCSGDQSLFNQEKYQDGSPCYECLFTCETLEKISKKITQLLEGVDSKGRNIVVPLDKIAHVVSQVYQSQNPIVGDIYSRYIISGIESVRNDIRQIIDRTISIIVTTIKDEFEVTENNNKLTIWTTLLGDDNAHGLRAHAPIKLKNRGPDRHQFNMNY